MNILQINSSARRESSHSTRLANRIVERLRDADPDATLTVRDLNHTPHPVLDEAALGALFTPADQWTPEQAARVAMDDALIAEIKASDGCWRPDVQLRRAVAAQELDRRGFTAGATFRYTEKGPEGLLKGKTVYVALTRGQVSQYAGGYAGPVSADGAGVSRDDRRTRMRRAWRRRRRGRARLPPHTSRSRKLCGM